MTLNKDKTLPKAKTLTETELRLRRTIQELEGMLSELEDKVSELEEKIEVLEENSGYSYDEIAELGD